MISWLLTHPHFIRAELMKKINPRYRCPNCGTFFVKDHVVMHLSSGTKFADVETGGHMSAKGGYKEIMYCVECLAPPEDEIADRGEI